MLKLVVIRGMFCIPSQPGFMSKFVNLMVQNIIMYTYVVWAEEKGRGLYRVKNVGHSGSSHFACFRHQIHSMRIFAKKHKCISFYNEYLVFDLYLIESGSKDFRE